MECAGLRSYFRFGAFAEEASSRAGLVRRALRQARRTGCAGPDTVVSLIGDHPNDIEAARLNNVRSIAVATGLSAWDELARHKPDLLIEDMRALSVKNLRVPLLP